MIIIYIMQFRKVTFNLNGFMMFRVTIIVIMIKKIKEGQYKLCIKCHFYFPTFGELLKKVSFSFMC